MLQEILTSAFAPSFLEWVTPSKAMVLQILHSQLPGCLPRVRMRARAGSEYPWLPLPGATCWLGVFLMLLMNLVEALSACNESGTNNMTKRASVHVLVRIYMRGCMC